MISKRLFENKNILVTGGTDSIGGKTLRKVLQYNPEVVMIITSAFLV